MTEKRFDCILNEFDEIEYISDIVDCEDRDFADFMDYVNEMAKENEQLKQDNQRLIKMLDNVANYMQKEHREIPLDDFVEWWNKMATEGLEND